MKYLLLLAVFPTLVHAAPWNQDCVTFWGKAIPIKERNQENCPTGHSHWDAIDTTANTQTRDSGNIILNAGYQQSISSNNLNPSTPTTVITNNGTYIIGPRYSGGNIPSAVIRSGK